jgi:hypothetical protein
VFRPRGPRPPCSVRLHLKGDPRTIEGILVYLDTDHYFLENARMIVSTVRDQDVPIDGRLWWQRKDVLHLQELG